MEARSAPSVVVTLVMAASLLSQAVAEPAIPEETAEGFRLEIQVPATVSDLYGGLGEATISEDIRERVVSYLEAAQIDMQKRGAGEDVIPSVGARELRVARYFSDLQTFAFKNSFFSDAGPAALLASDIVEVVARGSVSDLQILDSNIYGTEVEVRVSEFLRLPSRGSEEIGATVRLRLLTGRLASPPLGLEGRVVRTRVSHEPRFRIGDEVLVFLTRVPLVARSLVPTASLGSHPEILYKTRITDDEGFYEFLDVGVDPVIRDGILTVRRKSGPENVPVDLLLQEARKALNR